MIKNKLFGSILILSGTAIGAGMLALPLATQTLGFLPSLALFFVIWAVMTKTGLLIARLTCLFPEGSSFDTMAQAVLGKSGRVVMAVSMCALFYALLAAYTSGAGSFLEHYIALPKPALYCLIIIFFGSIISVRTAILDKFNRFFLLMKVGLFGLLLYGLSQSISFPTLLDIPTHSVNTWAIALPVLLTSFGFHGSVPSVVNYIGKDEKSLKKALILGSTIPLGVYIIWQALCLGSLPESTSESPNTLTSLIAHISLTKGGMSYRLVADLFAQFALITSLLGVGLGLYNFFQDALSTNTATDKFSLLPFLLTFTPPLLITLFNPEIFVKALAFAAIALCVLAIFLPTLMAFRLARKQQFILSLREKISLIFCFCVGACVVIAEFINLNLL